VTQPEVYGGGAHILAQLLRANLLPEAWIAPPAVR
jgi:hypothetical protein